MVVLDKLPSVEIIKALAGLVDFYMWKKIPVARAWPQYSPLRPSGRPKEKLKFKAGVLAYNQLSDAERIYWRKEGLRVGLNLRDAFMSHFLKSP